MRSYLKLILPVTAACLYLLSSCSTFDTSVLKDPSIRTTPDPLTLNLTAEPYMLRYDLIRAYDVVTTTGPNGQQQTRKQNRSYSDIGIDFGNGLMIDGNLNFFVDMTRFYKLPDSDFTIEDNNAKSLKTVCVYRRKGNEFTLSYPKSAKVAKTVTFNGDSIKIDERGFLKFKHSIQISADKITDNKIIDQTMERKSADKITFMRSLSAYSVEMPDPKTINVKLKTLLGTLVEYKIENLGDRIKVTQKDFNGSIFSTEKMFFFFRTAGGFYFYKSNKDESDFGSPVWLEKIENIVYFHQFNMFGDSQSARMIIQQ